MKFITLTTDMGLKDHYVASLKAVLLSGVKDLHVIDISHSVEPFNAGEAAYHVAACYRDFPKGTIHVVGVDSEPVINYGNSGGAFPSILLFEDQYFVSNDNGFFGTFLAGRSPQGFYRLDHVLSNTESFKFPTKQILCKAAISLANGKAIEDIASPHEHYLSAFVPSATFEDNLIKGHVIHIDHYGNLITNIHKSEFERMAKDVPYTIYFKSESYFIEQISATYNEVAMGEKVALFNQNGHLEIAINRAAEGGTGGANKLFGMKLHDVIRVVFTPQGSHKNFDTLL